MSSSIDESAGAEVGETRLARLAAGLRMTEGQLYTLVFALLVVVLVSLTGLPTAERTPVTSDRGDVPVLEPNTTVEPTP